MVQIPALTVERWSTPWSTLIEQPGRNLCRIQSDFSVQAPTSDGKRCSGFEGSGLSAANDPIRIGPVEFGGAVTVQSFAAYARSQSCGYSNFASSGIHESIEDFAVGLLSDVWNVRSSTMDCNVRCLEHAFAASDEVGDPAIVV